MRENSEHLNVQAIEHASHGEYPEAIACLQRALSFDKKNHLLWFNLGITYRNSGDLPLAKQSLLNAVSIEEMDDEILGTLGLVCFGLNQYEEAFEYYRVGLELNGENALIWNNLGVLHFSLGEFNEASEAFEEAITIDPHYYDALFNLRDAYVELGNSVGASVCEERLKQLKPLQ